MPIQLPMLRAKMTVPASGFDWDDGNRTKCGEHGLSVSTIEGLFTRPLAVLPDPAHSGREHRYRAVGRTKKAGEFSSYLRFATGTMRC